MHLGTISYWLSEAFGSMKKNLKSVLISVSTMLVTMLIIAVGYAVLKNSNYIVAQKQEASSKILAYMSPEATTDQIAGIRNYLENMDGVTKVEFLSTEEGINRMPQKDLITNGIPEEELAIICPPSFIITFKTLEAEEQIMKNLRMMDGIGPRQDDVKVTESAVSSIKKAKSAEILSITAMIIIVELSIILMINTTKLMIYSRRKEISIMKYVGAKDGFIKMPFAIEGIVIALIAVLVVIILFYFAYEPIIETVGSRASYHYLKLNEFMPSLTQMLIIIAVVIGAVGSTASMNHYLDV